MESQLLDRHGIDDALLRVDYNVLHFLHFPTLFGTNQ